MLWRLQNISAAEDGILDFLPMRKWWPCSSVFWFPWRLFTVFGHSCADLMNPLVGHCKTQIYYPLFICVISSCSQSWTLQLIKPASPPFSKIRFHHVFVYWTTLAVWFVCLEREWKNTVLFFFQCEYFRMFEFRCCVLVCQVLLFPFGCQLHVCIYKYT